VLPGLCFYRFYSVEIFVNNVKILQSYRKKIALLRILPFYDGFMELNHGTYLLEHFKDILQLAVQILHRLRDLRLLPLFITHLSVSLLLSFISAAPSFYVTVISFLRTRISHSRFLKSVLFYQEDEDLLLRNYAPWFLAILLSIC